MTACSGAGQVIGGEGNNPSGMSWAGAGNGGGGEHTLSGVTHSSAAGPCLFTLYQLIPARTHHVSLSPQLAGHPLLVASLPSW